MKGHSSSILLIVQNLQMRRKCTVWLLRHCSTASLCADNLFLSDSEQYYLTYMFFKIILETEIVIQIFLYVTFRAIYKASLSWQKI